MFSMTQQKSMKRHGKDWGLLGFEMKKIFYILKSLNFHKLNSSNKRKKEL
jgi:hypothetical protein